MSYADSFLDLLNDIKPLLLAQNVPAAKLAFGGETPEAKISVPTSADSKFQAEQALGDWAEDALARAIDAAGLGVRAVHYGLSSKTEAGQPGFADEFKAGIRDTWKHGKRPDLLILPDGTKCDRDISNVLTADTTDIVGCALFGLEVRSSRTEAERYIAYKASRLERGIREANPVPNFTVKTEDLVKVYRWIEVFDKPQIYAQVFFDYVYAIDFRSIIQYIATARKLNIINPKRSGKITIMVPITEGLRIAKVAEAPHFEVVHRVTESGRHDIFAKPVGGRIDLVGDALLTLV